MSKEPVTRNRRVYANTLLDLIKILYGVGIDPERVDFVRMDQTQNGRVLFHPIIDGLPVFEEAHTVETLQSMFEAMKVYRGFVAKKGTVEGLDAVPPTLATTNPLQASSDALGQLHQVSETSHVFYLRDMLNNSPLINLPKLEPTPPEQVKAVAATEKNPNRVAAGRRNAKKRWEQNRDKRRKRG